MAEEVNTGGLMRFKYGQNNSGKLSERERNEIKDAYTRADERKRREKLQRLIIWIIIGLIVVFGAGYFLLK